MRDNVFDFFLLWCEWESVLVVDRVFENKDGGWVEGLCGFLMLG